MNNNIEKLQKNINILNDNIEELQENINSLDKEIKEQQENIDTLNDKIQQTNNTINIKALIQNFTIISSFFKNRIMENVELGKFFKKEKEYKPIIDFLNDIEVDVFKEVHTQSNLENKYKKFFNFFFIQSLNKKINDINSNLENFNLNEFFPETNFADVNLDELNKINFLLNLEEFKKKLATIQGQIDIKIDILKKYQQINDLKNLIEIEEIKEKIKTTETEINKAFKTINDEKFKIFIQKNQNNNELLQKLQDEIKENKIFFIDGYLREEETLMDKIRISKNIIQDKIDPLKEEIKKLELYLKIHKLLFALKKEEKEEEKEKEKIKDEIKNIKFIIKILKNNSSNIKDLITKNDKEEEKESFFENILTELNKDENSFTNISMELNKKQKELEELKLNLVELDNREIIIKNKRDVDFVFELNKIIYYIELEGAKKHEPKNQFEINKDNYFDFKINNNEVNNLDKFRNKTIIEMAKKTKQNFKLYNISEIKFNKIIDELKKKPKEEQTLKVFLETINEFKYNLNIAF